MALRTKLLKSGHCFKNLTRTSRISKLLSSTLKEDYKHPFICDDTEPVFIGFLALFIDLAINNFVLHLLFGFKTREEIELSWDS